MLKDEDLYFEMYKNIPSHLIYDELFIKNSPVVCRVTHKPTGIFVDYSECSVENKETALKLLDSKVFKYKNNISVNDDSYFLLVKK